MATTKPAAPQPKSKPVTAAKPAATQKQVAQPTFLFDKTNYMWMGAGVLLIIIGFLLMAGGKSADPHQFNYDEIYSFRRVTLAPIVMLIGFAIEVYAIMKKPADANSNPTNTI